MSDNRWAETVVSVVGYSACLLIALYIAVSDAQTARERNPKCCGKKVTILQCEAMCKPYRVAAFDPNATWVQNYVVSPNACLCAPKTTP